MTYVHVIRRNIYFTSLDSKKYKEKKQISIKKKTSHSNVMLINVKIYVLN